MSKNLFIAGVIAILFILGFVWLTNASAESPYTIGGTAQQPSQFNALEVTLTCNGRTMVKEVPKANAGMGLFNRLRVSSGCSKSGLRVAYGYQVTIATDRLHKSDGQKVDVVYIVTKK